MEVGPTCHYVMGGVEVDPDTAAAAGVPGLFAAGEVAGGMHGSNRLGGNSLSDLLVFGRRAGLGAADYVDALGDARPTVADDDVDAAAEAALAPFDERRRREPVHAAHRAAADDERPGRHHPHARTRSRRRSSSSTSSRRARSNVTVEGHRQFNPGWHLALDLRNMLLVSECVAKAALERTRSPRRPHPRRLPGMEPDWRQVNSGLLAPRATAGARRRRHQQDQIPMRDGPARRCSSSTSWRSTSPTRNWPQHPERERTDGLRREVPGLARRRRRRRAAGLHRRGQRGRGRPRHHPPPAGHPDAATSPCAGTARPASAARAAPRSTAGRG